MRSIQGIASSGCTSPLGYHQSCTLTLMVNGNLLTGNVRGGPVLCEHGNPNQCYQPGPNDVLTITHTTAPAQTTFSVTPSFLGLSIDNTILNPALTGQPRQITIKNTGTNDATGLTITYPTWPAGTTATSTCTGSLAVNAECTITITPGADTTSNCRLGTAPTPADTAIIINATNATTPITANAAILSYGCIYQSGFIYAIDDTTPNINSIGGKVVSLTDQAAPAIQSGPQTSSIIWSSNGNGRTAADVSNDIIPLISEAPGNDSYVQAQTYFNNTYNPTVPFPSTTAFAACNGSIDGQCNTGNLETFYNSFNTNYGIGGLPYTPSAGATNLTYYAAGLCRASIDGYFDWYLPSMCEMDAVSNNLFNCPPVQSMQNSLPFLIGNFSAPTPSASCTLGSNCLAGYYWSSTQVSFIPEQYSWVEVFNTGASNQATLDKNSLLGVRCSRALTI